MKDHQLKIALQQLVFNKLRYPIITELFIFSLFMKTLSTSVDKLTLMIWYGLSIGFCLIRLSFSLYYSKNSETRNKINFWFWILIFCAFTSALSWSFIGSYFIPKNLIQQFPYIFLLIGVIAVGNVYYSPVRYVYFVFLSVAYIPHIIWNLHQGGHYISIAIMAIFYYGLMLIICEAGRRSITTALGLQFENLDLINDLKTAKIQLEYLNNKLAIEATHDTLTNLFNRHCLHQKLITLLANNSVDQKPFALLYCDLDKFKQVNDEYGHDVGDKLLVEVAQRLRGLVQATDVLARLGGDEFVIILNNIISLDEINVHADAMIKALQEKFLINGLEIYIGLSIGISIFPKDGNDEISLLKFADRALYIAKDHGRNRYIFYSE